MPEPVSSTFGAGLDEHVAVALAARAALPRLSEAEATIRGRLAAGGRLFSFGNGGSAADAQHFAAELVGRFARDRRPLAAIALSTDSSVVTCIANDYSFDDVFARQVEALAGPGDVVVAFSTSGRSENIVRGLAAARRVGAATILFTGEPATGGPGLVESDVDVVVPSSSTARIQEVHGLFVHLLSEAIDRWAAGADTGATG